MTVELLFVKSALVLTGAGLAARSLARASAATRAAVWTAAFAVLLALPVLEWALPAWRPLPELRATPDLFAPSVAASLATPDARTAPAGAPAGEHATHVLRAVPPATSVVTAGPTRLDRWFRLAAPWLLGAWVAGIVAGLLRLVLAHGRAFRLARRAEPADGPILAAAVTAAQRLGVEHAWRVALSDDLDVPVQCGLFSPVVLLPRDAGTWPADRRAAVLLHELAHVARRDCLLRLAGEVARTLYWPQPLVHWAVRHAGLALEQAADDAVLRAGTPRPAYAEHLAVIAATVGRLEAGAALAMARPSTLLPRVRAILDAGTDRATVGRRALVVTGLLALAGAASVGAVRLVGESADSVLARRARTALAAPEAAVRGEAVLTLGRLRDQDAAPALALRLRDAEADVRGMAAWALGRTHQAQAAPALAAALRDPDPYVRENAGMALAALGDRRWVPAVAALTRDTVWSVRAIAMEALGTLGGDEAGRAVADLLARETNDHTRQMAVWALRHTRSATTLPGLIALLADTSAELRGSALYALTDLGDRRAGPAVIAVLAGDTVPMVRGHAAAALGRFGDPAAIPALAAALRDADWRVRVSAADALGDLGGADAAAALVPALRDDVHQVRLTAVEALDRIASR